MIRGLTTIAVMNFEMNSCLDKVISFNPERVRFEVVSKKPTVIKKTSYSEYLHYIEARRQLNINPILISINGDSYTIRVPEYICWINSRAQLYTNYISGDNLEIIIRNRESHDTGVNVLLLILEQIKQARFFWKDFAPRNIIISKKMKSVYLVDFEKGLLKNQGWEDYLSLIFEELSIFLLPCENPIYKEMEKLICEENLILQKYLLTTSRRVRTFSDVFFRKTSKVLSRAEAYKYIISASLPYVFSNEIKYPVVQLERILQRNGYETWGQYAAEIVGKSNCEKEHILSQIGL